MRYWVKVSECQNVHQVTACENKQPSNWFIEVQKPSKKVMDDLEKLGEYSPYLVKDGKIVEDKEKRNNMQELAKLEEELQALAGTSTEDMIEVLTDAMLKFLPGGLPQLEGYKEKKRKKEEVKRLKSKLKGGGHNG